MALENQPREHLVDLELQTLTTRLSYAFTRNFALELEAPLRRVETQAAFKDVDGNIRDDFASIHHRNETIDGIGDLLLAGRFRISSWGSENQMETAELSSDGSEGTEPEEQQPQEPELVATNSWVVDLVVGISIPTGGTEEDPFVLGASGKEHQHVFFGSGTWDPSLRLDVYRTGQRANYYGWIGGSGALTDNSKGYRRGFGGSAGFGVSTSFGLSRTSFQAQLELQHSEPSTWLSQDARNSGSTDAVFALGASYQLTDSFNLRGQLRLPENIDASSGVIDPEPVALLGLSYWK